MPKHAISALVWSPGSGGYELREPGSAQALPLPEGQEERWRAWLAEHVSCSFRGRHGQVSLLKESRRNGAGYWYAYRRRGRKTIKRYLGPGATLTFARLEVAARALNDGERGADDAPSAGGIDRAAAPHLVGATEPPAAATVAAAGRDELSGPLLAPKLRPPRLPASLVPRERLLALLDGGLERRLTLVSAPAGYGKTTLVSQWAADRAARRRLPPVAWVALDAGDNDPVRFWRYAITACQAFEPERRPEIGRAALARLRAPRRSPFERDTEGAALTAFLNDLAQLPRGGMLVLEDFHHITAPQIAESVAFLVDHLPAAAHLVMITRADPPLPLARLRAHDDLLEVRTADLRFAAAEAETFMARLLPRPLDAAALARLDSRVEGWAAGLRLLALALQGQRDPEAIARALDSFAGSHRHIVEYLAADVLAAQPEPLQTFLLETSVLGRLSAELCDAVTGREDGADMLDLIERANLFLLPLDRGPGNTDEGAQQWYRYHALFAEAMRHEARRRLGDGALRACQRRASAWYAARGLLAEAIEAILPTQDWERAADLMDAYIERQRPTEAPELLTLQRWMEHMPEEVLLQHPELCVTSANILMFARGRRDWTAISPQLATLLDAAERAYRAAGERPKLGGLYMMRSLLAVWREEAAEGETYAREALAYLPQDDIEQRSGVLAILAGSYLLMGRIATARQIGEEALQLCEVAGNRHALRPTLIGLADMYFLQGELGRAGALCRQALDDAEDDLLDRARALLGLARLAYEWNDLETAARQAQESLDLALHLGDESLLVQVALVLARALHASGQAAQAERRLRALLGQTEVSRSPRLRREVHAGLARLQLADGRLAQAEQWRASRGPRDGTISALLLEQEELLAARLLIAEGKAEEALRALAGTREAARANGRTRAALESQMLMALAHGAGGRTREAKSLLREALARTRAEGFRRFYLDEGAAMATLLRAVAAEERERALSAYLQTLLRAFAPEGAADDATAGMVSARPHEPLSAQERRVLRLLVAGLSRQEIAGELVVSVNTVKTHLRRIYRKLGVEGRAGARRAARELGAG